MENVLIQSYLRGSPALDPAYVELRREVFGKARDWVDFKGALFDRQKAKMSGIPVVVLAPALGWEFSPWTQGGYGRPETLLAQLSFVKGWDVCQWNCIAPLEAQALASETRRLGFGFREYPFPVAVISGEGGYAAYLKRRSSSMNRNQRGAFRKIAAAGLEFRTELTWEAIERVVNSRVVTFSNGEDYSRTPAFRSFLRLFRERMVAERRFVETGLYEGSKLVAYDLGFWNGDIFHSYQTGYDPEYAQYRPGNATFEKTLERVLNQGVKLVDFMGDNPYFANFTRESLPMKRFVIFSRSLRARAIDGIMRLRRK